jgi:hypothetical protein
MLMLSKRLLTKEQMPIQKVRMPLYLAYLNNCDGIISKLCMALNLIFISIVWNCAISCNYVIIMWELYA